MITAAKEEKTPVLPTFKAQEEAKTSLISVEASPSKNEHVVVRRDSGREGNMQEEMPPLDMEEYYDEELEEESDSDADITVILF